MNKTKHTISELVDLTNKILNNTKLILTTEEACNTLVNAFKLGNKAIFCGNGGSAAEAQHLAAELSGRFFLNRPPLPAEACHVNTSFITGVTNDYSFEKSYARYIEAFGKPGDVIIGLSTSGNSQNIINAFIQAKQMGIKTIALTGKSGGLLAPLSELVINIPSENIQRIQETHLLIGHIICEKVEKELFGNL
jgi:D-sedoheptulose 7-phosphate isomerase